MPAWFQDLRTLCALVLTAAEPEDITASHPALADAFDIYVAERRRRDELRVTQRAAGNLRGGTPRLRPYTRVPQRAALMAALLAVAVPILEAESTAQQREQLAWLVDRLRARNPKGVSQLAQSFPFSPALARSIEPLVRLHVPAPLEALRGKRRDECRFTAANLPQLLWDDIFVQEFAHLLPRTKRDFARRFCSLALVRYREGCAWLRAAALLDLPETAAALAIECTGRLEKANTQADFASAIERVSSLDDRDP